MTPGPPGCFLCPSLILALQDGSETTGLCQHFASGDRGFSSLAQFWITEKKKGFFVSNFDQGPGWLGQLLLIEFLGASG